MKVSTFNIQNDYKKYESNKSNIIYEFIKKNNIDIIGMQEVFSKCDKDLRKIFNNSYNIVGKYRYIFKMFFPVKNEKNPIISKYKIIKNKTYYLPFLKSNYKRVLTHAIIDYDGKEISIYNTHLEVKKDEVKRKQLNKIFNIIGKDNRPKILMGDFNLKDDNPLFKEYADLFKSINMKNIDINERTLIDEVENKAIDHIMISNDFKLNNLNIIKNLNISDHYPVLIDVELKNTSK